MGVGENEGRWAGHIDFGTDPFGVGMTFPFLHNIRLYSYRIFMNIIGKLKIHGWVISVFSEKHCY